MLCAGITVYRPLLRLVKEGARVGVIGIGGLGHLALQFARAMGAEVYAISTSEDKRNEAARFGAQHFVDFKHLETLSGTLDLLISTATGELDWARWLTTLRPQGTFCLLGASPGPVTLPVLPMIFGEYFFTASVVGSPARITDMLRFAAAHKIETEVETFPLDQVNEALQRVRTNQARYRIVLTVP